jgi:hypothetical protein
MFVMGRKIGRRTLKSVLRWPILIKDRLLIRKFSR